MHQAFNAIQVVIRGTDLALQIAFGPNLVTHACSWVLHAGVEASRRGYVQYRSVMPLTMIFLSDTSRTNKYLDEVNRSFFRPHNLYALIMCYKPLANLEPSDTLEEAVSSRVDGEGGKLSRASGTTRSELELPEVAPLIFPDLDAVPDKEKPSKSKRAGAFLSDYYDRRAASSVRALTATASEHGTDFI